MTRVFLGDLALFDGARILGGLGQLAGDDEVLYLAYPVLTGEGDGVFPAQLEAVVLLGVVRGGDHGPARLLQVPDREVERVGGDLTEIEHVCARLRHALYEGAFDGLAGEPHVPGHDYPGARQPQMGDEGAADVPRDVLVQAVRVYASDVVGLEYRLVEHLPLATSGLANATARANLSACWHWVQYRVMVVPADRAAARA